MYFLEANGSLPNLRDVLYKPQTQHCQRHCLFRNLQSVCMSIHAVLVSNLPPCILWDKSVMFHPSWTSTNHCRMLKYAQQQQLGTSPHRAYLCFGISSRIVVRFFPFRAFSSIPPSQQLKAALPFAISYLFRIGFSVFFISLICCSSDNDV